MSQAPAVSRQELAVEQREQEAYVRAEKAKKTTAASSQKTDRKQLLAQLKAAAAPVGKSGQQICREMRGSKASCDFPFALDEDTSTDVNAYTDGKQIVVSPAMMQFVQDADELAVVLAHEYAHAVMGHPGKTQQNAAVGGLLGMAADILAQSQGLNTGGAFGKLGVQGAVLRYSQSFEREADYIGMYILARAGYPIAEAARFWRRMATVNPQGIYNSSTHPTTAERYLLLNKTAQEIKRKQTSSQPLLPEKMPEE